MKMPRASNRYRWRPAQFSNGDVVSLALTLLAGAFLSAGDYGTGFAGRRSGGTLGVLEEAYPIWLFFSILATGSVFLGLGMLVRWHIAVWLGHALLAGANIVLTTAAILALNQQGGFDGVRFIGLYATVAMLHVILAIRTGPKPLLAGEGSRAEVIITGDGDDKED